MNTEKNMKFNSQIREQKFEKQKYDKTYEAMKDRYEHDLHLSLNYKEKLNRLPEGSLSKKRIRNKDCIYYQYKVVDEYGMKFRQRYLGKKEKTLIDELCERRFLLKSLPILENNINILSYALDRFQTYDTTEIWARLPRVYQIGNIENQRDSENFPVWQNNKRKYSEETANLSNDSENEIFNESGLKHTTIKGVRVRSKSEALIANELEMYEISYRYEAWLSLGDRQYLPDFTILRQRDRRVMYWEHFGMLNDPKYVMNMDRKLKDYRKIGIVPWHNLITTYDLPDGSIDVRDIDRVIKAFLI